MVRPPDPDPAIPCAASAFARGVPVSEVTSRRGLLPLTFVRRFRAQVGLTSKRFSRVRRLQRVVRSVADPSTADWSGLAAGHGYTDQAHLIHDFRALTGITPSAYRPALGRGTPSRAGDARRRWMLFCNTASPRFSTMFC
jgi:AraC-like DNA-binding protein